VSQLIVCLKVVSNKCINDVSSDEYERRKAVEVLNQCRDEVIRPLLKGKPLALDINGLEIMNDDPGLFTLKV
jgi:hypothetical protein